MSNYVGRVTESEWVKGGDASSKIQKDGHKKEVSCWKSKLSLECVKVLMPAHQVLPLTE